MSTLTERLADRMFGPIRYTYTPVPGGSTIRTLRLPEGDYLVSLNLQSVTRGRERGIKQRRPYVVDWKVYSQVGIPTAGPLRKRVFGAGVGVTENAVAAGTWPSEATAAIALQIARFRTANGWEPTAKVIVPEVSEVDL